MNASRVRGPKASANGTAAAGRGRDSFVAGGKPKSEVRPVIPGEGEEGPVPAFATKNCRKFREENSPEIRDEVGSRRRRRTRPEAPPRHPLSASIATLALV